MKSLKYFFVKISVIVLTVFRLSASENIDTLLSGYLSNNVELQNLSNQLQRVMLESQITDISNGFSFKLSSGTITFTTGENWNVRFTPSASIAIPQARGLEIGVNSTLLFDSNDATETFGGVSIKVGVDIISNKEKNREITLLKSQRKVLEAQRAVQNGFVSAEKKFYETLKSLYELSSRLNSLEKELQDNNRSLDTLKAQGYNSSSTKYKNAQMKIKNSEHDVEGQKKNMERQVKIFCSECGVDYNYENPVDFLPSDVPSVEPILVNDFSVDEYAKIESLKWNQYINQLQRDATSAITLKANAGYTFQNDKAKSNTINLGTDFTWNNTGLVLSAGANLPVGTDSFNPIFTLGVSFDPNALKTAKLNDQITEIEISQEELDLKNALTAYDTVMVSQNSSLDNLLWEQSTCNESYEMYKSLETEMARYYKQGYISQSEYKDTQLNKETYRIKILLNKLNIIIYNNETTLLFVRDGELKNNDSADDTKNLVVTENE